MTLALSSHSLFAALGRLQAGEARAALEGLLHRRSGALLARQMGARKGPAGSRLWARHFAARQPAIRRTQLAIIRQLRFAKNELLRNIEHSRNTALRASDASQPDEAPLQANAAFDLMFDAHRFKEGLLAALRHANEQTLHEAGGQALRELGVDDPFTMPAREMTAFLASRENKLSDTPQTIFEQIRRSVLEGVNGGESHAQLAKRVRGEFAGIEQGRAETIALTETGAGYGVSRHAALKQSGIEYKRWLTSQLPTVRATHREAEAENTRVPVDEPFMVAGEALMYPGDESGSPENVINCHCVELAVAA